MKDSRQEKRDDYHSLKGGDESLYSSSTDVPAILNYCYTHINTFISSLLIWISFKVKD